MKPLNSQKIQSLIILAIVLVGSVLLAMLSYSMVTFGQAPAPVATAPGPVATVPPKPTRPLGPTPTLPAVENPSRVLGVDGNPDTPYPDMPWIRLGYPTCGWGTLRGDVLRGAIEDYHRMGVRVLLTVCQGHNTPHLYDTQPLTDAAQGNADAVQCGNEEMKQDPSLPYLYIPPENFARFYDECQFAVRSIRPEIPIMVGSLDPHVGGVDYQPLLDQVHYLDQMQTAMNIQVHPGGHWDWHTQTLGLIDSWHNGYPDGSVNSLSALFSFWAKQFHVSLNSGALGKHLWVVEGTGCFKDCGINSDNASQVAISHILTLITDVQTAMRYGIPFFYFSGKDFDSVGYRWPIGILDIDGRAKPIRQDLAMGARKLQLSCATGNVSVADQEQLLAKLYSGCTLPPNYVSIITS